MERWVGQAGGEPDVSFDAADVRIRELARLHEGVEVEVWRADPTSPVPFSTLAVRRRWLGRLVTFHFVCAGWVMFHAGTVPAAGVDRALEVFGALASGWGTAPVLLNPLVVGVIGGAIALQFLPSIVTRQLSALISTVRAPVVAVGVALWIMVVVALGPEGVSEFIYFQF